MSRRKTAIVFFFHFLYKCGTWFLASSLEQEYTFTPIWTAINWKIELQLFRATIGFFNLEKKHLILNYAFNLMYLFKHNFAAFMVYFWILATLVGFLQPRRNLWILTFFGKSYSFKFGLYWSRPTSLPVYRNLSIWFLQCSQTYVHL